MKLKSLIYKPTPLKAVLSVHLTGISDNQFRAEWAVLSRSKGKIIPLVQQTARGTLAEINQELPEKYPVVLSLDGKGVLYKTWNHDWNQPKQVFRELVPQADYNDFYVQIHPSADKAWVAISRKDFVKPIIQELSDKSRTVIDLQLGLFMLEKIRPLLADESSEWNLPDRTITWEGNFITSFLANQPAEQKYFYLGDEAISSEHLTAFAYAVFALTHFEGLNVDFPDQVETREQFIYKQRIQKTGVGILLFYMGLLVVNYLLFTHYSDRLNLTLASYQNSLKMINRLEQLTSELKQKEDLARKTGFGNRDQLSFIADRLAASLPGYIQLTSLAINPLNDKQHNRENPEFQQNQILISGELNNGVKLYSWLEQLKKVLWITSIEVIDLEQEELNKPAKFTIELTFNLSNSQSNR